MQLKQAIGAGQARIDRDVIPIERKLDDGCLPLGRPGEHPGGSLADTGLVYDEDLSALSAGSFKGDPSLAFPRANSNPDCVRWPVFWGFWQLNSVEPRMRHTLVWPKRTRMHSMTVPTRLRDQSSVPNPCSMGLCRRATRIDSSCPSSSWAGRPRSGTSRSASIPLSSRSRFHVYTV